jgi:hypothetical protein
MVRSFIIFCLLICSRSALAQEQLMLKVSRVVIRSPSDWRILVSMAKDGFHPVSLAESSLSVFLAEGESIPPDTPLFLKLEGERPAKGFKGGAKEMAKSDIKQSVVIVLAMHALIRKDVRSLYEKAIAEVLGGLKKDARVAIIAYNDLLWVLSLSKNGDVEVCDVNDPSVILERERRRRYGEKVDETYCSNIFVDPQSAKMMLSRLPPAQGFFPRLFGIDEAQEIVQAAVTIGHFRLDRERDEYFAKGALEATLKLFMLFADDADVHDIVLVSDGKDGYLMARDVIAKKIAGSSRCTRKVEACHGASGLEDTSEECTRQVLACVLPDVGYALKKREDTVRANFEGLLPLLQSFGVRIFTISLASDDPACAMRLQALSLKTGGTFRDGASPDAFLNSAKDLASEISSEFVVKPKKSLKGQTRYTVEVASGGVRSLPLSFTTPKSSFFFEPLYRKGRQYAIGRLGHFWGPIAYWCVLALVAVMAFFMLRNFGRMIKGIFSAKKATKAKQAVPKIPKIPPPRA